MELIKLVLFVYVLLLVGKTSNCGYRKNYQLILVKGITEVPSRGGIRSSNVVYELPDEEKLKTCHEAFEITRHDDIGKKIQFLENREVDVFKEYVIELGHDKWSVSFKLLAAFECPTNPALYIYVDVHDTLGDSITLWVIFKDTDSEAKQENIMGYQVAFVKDVTEAFSDELGPRIADNVENSMLDTDELSEEERLQMCRRAMRTVSEIDIALLENTRTSASKFYVLKRSEPCNMSLETESSTARDCDISPEIESSTARDYKISLEAESSTVRDYKISSEAESSTARNTILGIVQAFQCPTAPEIYIHVNYEKFAGLTLWAFMKESEGYPALEFIGYQLKAFLEIVRVSPTIAKQINPDNSEKSVIDFDILTEVERRKMCLKAVRTVFGGALDIDQNAEIKRSKLYALYDTEDSEIEDLDLVQAIRCPTTPAIYIYVSKRECNGNILWILIRRNDLADLTSRI